MNPYQVKTWVEVEAWLKSKGFVPTSQRTPDGSGCFWRSRSNRHIVVPDHIDGFYPDIFYKDLVRRVQAIVP